MPLGGKEGRDPPGSRQEKDLGKNEARTRRKLEAEPLSRVIQHARPEGGGSLRAFRRAVMIGLSFCFCCLFCLFCFFCLGYLCQVTKKREKKKKREKEDPRVRKEAKF